MGRKKGERGTKQRREYIKVKVGRKKTEESRSFVKGQ
jgi:hypothetical protein